MKFNVAILISSLCTLVKTEGLDTNRRDGIGYSASIVHQNPQHPDQQAQSAVEVQFLTPDIKQSNRHANGFPDAYTYSAPKLPLNYLQYQTQTQTGGNRQAYGKHVTAPARNIQPGQAFNVGYSVSFTNGAAKPVTQTVPQSPEIITGSNKEEVARPISAAGNEEFVLNAFLDSKKQKLSGIKPKYYRPVTSAIDTKHLLAQANLSPKTQGLLFALEGDGTAATATAVQQSVGQANYNGNAPWKMISPNVEVYHSSTVYDDANANFARESSKFDHAKALGKSEGFDYSDAVDLNNVQANSNSNRATHGAGYNKKSVANLYNTKPIAVNVPIKQLQPINLRTSQLVPHQIELKVDSKKYLPPAQMLTSGAAPKLPMDTSLLRDPVLTVGQNSITKNANAIPIQFDTTLLQQAIDTSGIDFTNQAIQNLEAHSSAEGILDGSQNNLNYGGTVGGNLNQIYKFDQFTSPNQQVTYGRQYVQNSPTTGQGSYQAISELFKFPKPELTQADIQAQIQQHFKQPYAYASAKQQSQLSPANFASILAYGTRGGHNQHVLGQGTQDSNMYDVKENQQYDYISAKPNDIYKNYKVYGKGYSDSYVQYDFGKELLRRPRLTMTVKGIDTELRPPPRPLSRFKKMYMR